jgi:Ca2+-transporting ATPase
VGGIRANAYTGTLTVTFDDAVTYPARVLAAAYCLAQEDLVQHGGQIKPANPHTHEVLTYGSQTLVSGGALAYLTWRRAATGSAMVADSPALFGLAAAATLFSGYPLLQKGLNTLARGKRVSPELLLAMSSIVLSLLRGNILGLSVIFLVHLNNLLQSLITYYAHRKLTGRFPAYDAAYPVERGAELMTLPLAAIEPGDKLRLVTGQTVPVDGRVISGTAIVDELAHTGEVDASVKAVDDAIWAGTRIEKGELRVGVTQVGANTLLGQMLRASSAMRPAEEEPNLQRTATLGNFAIAAAALALVLGQPQLALAVLLAGNPAPLQHARVLPLGSVSRVAYRHGIVVRRPQRLAALSHVDVMLFDKSATLTEGRAAVVDVVPLDTHYSERDILRLAASAEQGSAHHLAQAIVAQAKKQKLALRKTQSQRFFGNGILAEVSGAQLLLGNEALMQEYNVDLHKAQEAVRTLRLVGASPIYLAKNSRLIGVVACRDLIRPESQAAIEALQALGINHIGMITGDSRVRGEEVGTALGIAAVWTGLSPKDKMYVVKRLKQHGYTVAVIGDGHNDLLAMGAADVSIAFQPPRGSEALRVADVVILDRDPRKVAHAVYLARHAHGLSTQNSIVATAVSLLGIGLSLLGRISLGTAAVLPTLSSLGIVANSLRATRLGPPCPETARAETCATLAPTFVPTLREHATYSGKTEQAVPPNWHALLPEQVLTILQSCARYGLTTAEATRRLTANGHNVLPVGQRPSPWRILWDQFNDAMVRILIGAAGLSLALGHPRSAIITLGVVLFNAMVGTWQEIQNNRSLEMLQRLVTPTANVQRDGSIVRIESSKVVPGDVLVLEAGDRVPADARIIAAQNLQADEAPLTGESLPVSKQVPALDLATALAERKNMLYMGTVITRGRGKAVVVSTSAHTEVGQISTLMSNNLEIETPLKRSLDELARYVTYGCLAISGFILAAGLWRGNSVLEMLMLGTSLAVAAIPEGLASAVTIALAIGVHRMVKRGILIRKLPALETLGCTTVICSDKTGTLTKNEMTVRKLFVGGNRYTVTGEGYKVSGHFEREDGVPIIPGSDPALMEALRVALHCNNAFVVDATKKRQEQIVQGDPTEAALLVAALKGGVHPERESHTRVLEIPFESASRRMSVVCENANGMLVSYCKGAVDVVMENTTHVWTPEGPRLMTDADREQILGENRALASRAMRVLALAVKTVAETGPDCRFNDIETGLTFVGLAGLFDPPRREVHAALAKCRQAGIRVVMITGDQPLTAQAIADELGILSNADHFLTGKDVDNLNDEQLAKVVGKVEVFARATPHHKLRIVTALKQLGQIVAMTGDGVNDGPALKAAHIGIAMGSGTEVSKEAASLVISDDNFATIVTGIEEGRAVFSNIRKAIRYLLATNAGEVVAMALATLAGLPAPLTALQLLWVNLLGDGLPAIALINDPPSEQVMQTPPRNTGDGILAHGLGRKILQRGIIVGVTSLLAFRWKLASGASLLLARTVALATVTLSQFVHLFDVRSDARLGKVGLFSNHWLIVAALASLGLLVALIQLPWLQGLIGTTALSLGDWLLAGQVAALAALLDLIANRCAEARHPLKAH